uniref:Putative lambda recombination protein n=1 Tax=viral metagenome TaxID=1070528 RepID=A0A6H1ZE28_9ZZZZ
MNPIFTGEIIKGKLKLDNPHKYLVQIAALNGKKIELVLRRRKSKRSLAQNAAYWGIAIEILKNHLGYDKDEMHHALKVKFASKTDPDTGLVIVESTTKMDTKRFIEYYESIQRWAAEFLDCYIPSPNESDYQDGDFK